MKFAIASYIHLAEELNHRLNEYDFSIMITGDEEIGGENGVKFLLDQGYRSEVCVLPDGGDNWQLETGCNGVWMIRLTAPGKTAHGSRPWEGINAIEKLATGLIDVKKLFGDARPGNSTITISQIGGGVAINQVPEEAYAHIDMRFADQADYETKSKQVRSIAESLGLRLDTVSQSDVGRTDLNNVYVKRFIEISARVSGQEIGRCHSYGGSDARFFAIYNIPTILMRPNGGGAHSEYEWISQTGLEQYFKVLKAYVTEVAKKS